jgi:NO-binding membrane sensor protein with MHYT domain/CheY-like chemotaxis protein
MPQHYHHGFVALSVFVAMLASYTALTLALRLRAAFGWTSRAWLFGGGLAMGIGIWAMHFVGMLALSLPIPIAYDIFITAVSMVIAIAVSTFALHIASRKDLTRPRLIAAGLAMGVGICSMHYVGMAAILIDPPIRYNAYWVAASFAIAVAASFAALWVVFSTREKEEWWRIPMGSIVMGFAIVGMHYAGMVAAQFPRDAVSQATSFLDQDRGWLAGSVTTSSLFILLGTLLVLFMDRQASLRRARMQASLAEVRQSSRAKDEFLAMLGHELRNPLAAISNAMFLLRRSKPTSSEWSYAQDVIERQSAHLRHLVDDLLDVGRAINGKLTLDVRTLDLRIVVDDALRMLATAGKTAGRTIDWRGETIWVRGDETRLHQVLANLVSNAVNNTSADGLIEVRVARRGGDACLVVRDNGVGLDRETASHVFDLFYQADQGLPRGKGGLGIGLTLVQRIVQLHHGEVKVESEGPGRGSSFTVRLAAIDAEKGTAVAALRAGPRSARTVLVVEDAEDARQSLRLALEMNGHSVHTAADGETGLRALLDLRPDIALIDIGLPKMDGYEVARRARSAGVRARLVALTGYGLPEDKAQAVESGFDIHVTKPAKMEEIMALVSEAPERGRSASVNG